MIRSSLTAPTHVLRGLGLAAALCLTVGSGVVPAHAAEATVGLGTAGSFAVLAGQSVTNTGASVVTGDIGVSPGTSVTGIPPLVQTGALHVTDAVAAQAQADLVTAYDSAAGRPTVTDVTGQDLGGRTLVSGVVEHTSGMQLTGTLTLDAQGDPDAVFIFKAGSTLVTASNSTVALINGASPCNVFWQVGSSTTLGTGTTFVGTVMSLTSATLDNGASVQGRILARNGSVTLDTNVISRPICTSPGPTSPSSTSSPTATPSPSSTATPSPSATPSTSDDDDENDENDENDGNGNNGNNGNSGNNGNGGNTDNDGAGDGATDDDATAISRDTPVVPTGHPATGRGGASPTDRGALGLLIPWGGAALVAVGGMWCLRARPARPI